MSNTVIFIGASSSTLTSFDFNSELCLSSKVSDLPKIVFVALPLKSYKEFDSLFEEDVYNEISLETCVGKRISEGGTGPDSVNNQIKVVREFLDSK